MVPSRTIFAWSAAGLCLAISLVVQSQIITRAPLHEDEAFYTAYSRDILHGQPFLTSEGVEKPPVFFYWQALFMAVAGEGPAGARLANVAAVLIAIVFAFRMARRIYDDVTAGAIAVVMALSPFYVLYGPTAFTDVIAVTLAIGSLERLSARSWFWSGVLAAGSMFSKQYYVLFLGYNVLAMAMIPSLRPNKSEAKQWALGVFYVSLPVIFWATFLNYPPWEIVRAPQTLYQKWPETSSRWASLQYWIDRSAQVLGSPVLNRIYLAAVAFLFWDNRREQSAAKKDKARWDIYWVLVIVSYIGALGFQLNIPHFDRYILLVVVPICILAGRAFTAVAQRLPTLGAIPVSVLILLLLGNSFYTQVWRRGYTHGANYDAHVGLDSAFAYTNEHFHSANGLVAFQGSGFFQRYYAYRAPYPVLSVVTQDQIFQRLRNFAFNPVWMLVYTANGPLAFENWPKEAATIWAPRMLYEKGHYQVWEFLPNEQFRKRSVTSHELEAGLKRLWNQPVSVRRLDDTRFELRGPFPLRDGIMATFTSIWSGVKVYDNGTWMIGRIQETKTTFEMKTDAAVATLARQNRNIIGLRFDIGAENEIAISGTVTNPTLPFRVVLRTALVSGKRIRVEIRSIRLDRISFPAWFCRLASRYIPPQNLKIPPWAGDATDIRLDPAQQSAIILAVSPGRNSPDQEGKKGVTSRRF